MCLALRSHAVDEVYANMQRTVEGIKQLAEARSG